MFRKPKKKPSALRTSGGSSAGAKQATKKRPRQTRDSSSSDDDDDANDTSDLLQQIRQERSNNETTKKSKTLLNTSGIIKSKNKSSTSGGSSMMHEYKSSTDHQLSAQEMATRTAEYHPVNKDAAAGASDTSGAVAQNAALPSLSTTTPSNPFHAGPLRATTFVRTTARFDYQPDICKDYKETGFCGFGDTCIYLHDRGDSKSGWQMEAEYEEKKKRGEERKGREMERFMNSMMCGEVGTDNNDDDAVKKSAGAQIDKDQHDKHNNDGIPYACHICRSAFQSPVITTCGHYFCESCMQRRIREEQLSTCPICQKDTHGVLNYPQKLVSKKRRLVGRDGTWEEYLAKK